MAQWLRNIHWDNNPGIPYGFIEGVYYQCSPGTYNYDYEDDYAYYWGTYTLTIEYGEDGEMFWVDGDDGDDSYFTLNCNSDYYRGERGEKVNREITKQEPSVITGEIVNTIHQEFRSGIYKLEINLNVVEK